ncbi:MAG: GGDEF domain-containing protein [Deltaproteobacteria bacterium]|nr:GGDEF domain-containing protein [Deltaproteobacteria bacterium]
MDERKAAPEEIPGSPGKGAVEDVLDSPIDLPSPPAIAVRILKLVRDDESSFRELAQVVSSDPALAAKTLSLANSSIYGFSKKVDSIDMALTVLGCKALKNIALSFVIAQEMKEACGDCFDFNGFWKEALTLAVATELLSVHINRKNDDTFVTALLQNIGYLVMCLIRPAEFVPIRDLVHASMSRQLESEKEIFRADHPEMGAAMLRNWGLPDTIHVPIRFHHQPEECPEAFRPRAELLAVADRIASIYHGFRSAERVRDVQQLLQEQYGMTEEEIHRLIDRVAEETRDVLSTFEISPEDIKPYSQMLLEANRELCNLSLSYEQYVVELQQAEAEIEKLASELMEANSKLRSLVFRDSLTGVFGHRYFHEMLESEFLRSQRHGRYLSLIVFDVDNFKVINDRNGHLAGDLILKAVARRVACVMRSNEILARFGGDEFAVILPETDAAGCQAFADRIRQKVEKMKIRAAGKMVRVTISLGGTTFAPGMEVQGRETMIEVADRALYFAKGSGKNRAIFFDLGEAG